MKSPLFVARRPRQAFALVLVLIILALLAVVAVGFLSSMTTERATSSAYSNKARASQAAQAGVDAAIAMVVNSITAFPDSATVWDPAQATNSGGNPAPQKLADPPKTNPGTTLFFRATPDEVDPTIPAYNPTRNVPIAQPDSRRTFALPLVSGVPGGKPRLVSQKSSLLPAFNNSESNYTYPAGFEQNYTDLNVRRFAGDSLGAIGSPPGWYPASPTATQPKSPQPIRAAWVNFRGEAQRAPADSDSSNDVVTSRYAFWVEDESFRANVNYAGAANATRGDNNGDFKANTVARSALPSDISLQGSMATIGGASTASADAASIVTTRLGYPGGLFPEPFAFEHTSGVQSALLDRLRFLTSTTSSSLNLSRHGSQRFNLNTIANTPSLGNTGLLQRQVDQIVATLKFHLPNWGQRFYRLTAGTDATTLNNATMVTGSNETGNTAIYYYKTAANLHDYVDDDTQPTIISAPLGSTLSPKVDPPSTPEAPFGDMGSNLKWAEGKEAVPYLQETVVRFRPVVHPSTKNWDLKIDYYLEFWNMSDKDVYAAQQDVPNQKLPNLGGAYVKMSSQQTWVAHPSGGQLRPSDGSAGPVEGRDDYKIDLTQNVFLGGSGGQPQDGKNGHPLGVLFKAGACTVITTDPDCDTYSMIGPPGQSTTYKSLTGLPANTYYCGNLIGDGKREYTGSLANSSGAPTTDYGIKPTFRNGSQDYGTEVTLANPNGYLDCVQFAVAEGGSPVNTSTDIFVGKPGTYNDYGYGGSLLGNAAVSQTGDPRTNNEQISYQPFVSGGNPTTQPDQSRYWNGDHTLGYPDANYVHPEQATMWPDYYKFPPTVAGYLYPNPGASNAPAVVADAPLTSIGQLGDVFDPARKVFRDPMGARGGGRTYKIGQKDDLYSSDPTGNAAPNKDADAISASTSWASWRLADIFCVSNDLENPGRININGVARDGGAALRAALGGFNFQPTTASSSTPPTTPPPDSLVHGDAGLAGKGLAFDDATQGFSKLITAMTDRLGLTGTAPRPFFERGEFGELGTLSRSIFGVTGAGVNSDLVSGVDMSKAADRGREELVRRTLEMICTRGDVFTVYAAGQAVTQAKPSGGSTPPKYAAATDRLKVTFRLRPKNVDAISNAATDFHPGYTSAVDGKISATDFDPNDQPAITARFKSPDRYDVEILQSTPY